MHTERLITQEQRAEIERYCKKVGEWVSSRSWIHRFIVAHVFYRKDFKMVKAHSLASSYHWPDDLWYILSKHQAEILANMFNMPEEEDAR